MKNIITKGYRVRLLPTPEQEKKLFDFAHAARFFWNHILYHHKQSGDKWFEDVEYGRYLTTLKKTEGFTWLNNFPRPMFGQILSDIKETFRENGKCNYKTKKTKLAFYHKYDELKVSWNACCLQKIGWIKFKEYNRIPPNYIVKRVNITPGFKSGFRTSGEWIKGVRVGNPRITYDGVHWWLSCMVEEEIDIPSQLNGDFIGIDLGLKTTAVLSNGKTFNYDKKKLDKLERQAKHIDRRRQRRRLHNRKRKSREAKRLAKRYRQIWNHITNHKLNVAREIGAYIVKQQPKAVIMEHLKVQIMMKNKHLSRAIQNAGWYRLRKIIDKKCMFNDIPFRLTKSRYPSSKLCSNCGHKKKDLKLWERTYICPECGYIIDRDLNAAINLAKLAYHLWDDKYFQDEFCGKKK